MLQQMTQVIDCKRYRLQEVGLLLKISSKTICAQYLHGTEQHKVLQRIVERLHIYWHILLQLIYILCHQFFAQVWVEVRLSLPQERCYVVVHRTFASALKIDKVWHQLALIVLHNHHIARLEVAVHKRTIFAAQ